MAVFFVVIGNFYVGTFEGNYATMQKCKSFPGGRRTKIKPQRDGGLFEADSTKKL
jgi:hypothetical protein